jgi:hypothetical protein
MNYHSRSPRLLHRMSCWVFVLVCFFLGAASWPSSGPDNNQAVRNRVMSMPSPLEAQPQNQDDTSSIDRIVTALYDAITFRGAETPDLERLRALFTPDAPFIRITAEGPHNMTTASFIASFSERIKTGALKSFHESEVFRKTNAYGSIAQVFSTYRKGLNTEDPARFVRGINGLQLYHDGRRWWISGIVWEDEQPGRPIPREHLRKAPSSGAPSSGIFAKPSLK